MGPAREIDDGPSTLAEGRPEPVGRSRFLRDAARSAELDTGRRERTHEGARRNIVARIAVIAVGSVVTLGGLAMLVLPGPGIVVVILGLGILAQELPWAERLLAYAKRKSGADKVKDQPRWVKVVMVLASVAAVGASAAWVIAT